MPAFRFENVMCRLDLSWMNSILILRRPVRLSGLLSPSDSSSWTMSLVTLPLFTGGKGLVIVGRYWFILCCKGKKREERKEVWASEWNKLFPQRPVILTLWSHWFISSDRLANKSSMHRWSSSCIPLQYKLGVCIAILHLAFFCFRLSERFTQNSLHKYKVFKLPHY